MMRAALIVVFEIALIGTLVASPTRARRFFILSLLGLMLALAWPPQRRHIGDSGEYVAMAVNLVHGSPPSMSVDDLPRARAFFAGDANFRLDLPRDRAPDGRYDFPHFWFYPLLAAPFVGLALSIGAHPVVGFTALNVLLLLSAAFVMHPRVPPPVSLLLAAGPILWWVDKAHTEVFTFALVAVAVVLLRSAPWWSIVALGAAATQNPPAAGAMLIAAGYAGLTVGWRERRVWLGFVAGAALAAMHPLYYHARLGVWTGLHEGIDRHWPSIREVTTVMWDPNIGILVHDPFFTLAIVIAAAGLVHRRRVRMPGLEHATVVLIAALFLFSFTQTGNFNAGGTPGPSRYGLWLLPLAIPLLAMTPQTTVWMRVVAVASVVWCTALFSPRVRESYERPTRLAAVVWRVWPNLDNPLTEIFAERISGLDAVPQLPQATRGCEKVLLVGAESETRWPSRCTATAIPRQCREAGTLCYANRSGTSYQFTPAPSGPAWRRDLLAGNPSVDEQILTISNALPPPRLPMPAALWLDDGWSYLERAPGRDAAARPVEWRWMGDRARVGLMTEDATTARLRILVRAFDRPRRVRLSLGETELTTLVVAPDMAHYETRAFQLSRGTIVLTVECLDGADFPGTEDLRRLGMALFRLELVIVE